MPLTDTVIDTAKPKDKPYKLTDGGGLYLLVMPNTSKYFRLDYRLGGKRKTLAIGVYPGVSLDTARIKRDTAKQHIKDGIDPGAKTVLNSTDTVTPAQTIHGDLKATIAQFTKTESAPIEQENQKLKRELDVCNKQLQDTKMHLDTLLMFNNLSPDKKELLFMDGGAVNEKLKGLMDLRKESDRLAAIKDYADDELVDEVNRRGLIGELDIFESDD